MNTRRSESNRETKVGGTVSKCIGPHFTEYIDSLIESGRYMTVAEVLREALRIHEKHQEPREAK